MGTFFFNSNLFIYLHLILRRIVVLSLIDTITLQLTTRDIISRSRARSSESILFVNWYLLLADDRQKRRSSRKLNRRCARIDPLHGRRSGCGEHGSETIAAFRFQSWRQG